MDYHKKNVYIPRYEHKPYENRGRYYRENSRSFERKYNRSRSYDRKSNFQTKNSQNIRRSDHSSNIANNGNKQDEYLSHRRQIEKFPHENNKSIDRSFNYKRRERSRSFHKFRYHQNKYNLDYDRKIPHYHEIDQKQQPSRYDNLYSVPLYLNNNNSYFSKNKYIQNNYQRYDSRNYNSNYSNNYRMKKIQNYHRNEYKQEKKYRKRSRTKSYSIKKNHTKKSHYDSQKYKKSHSCDSKHHKNKYRSTSDRRSDSSFTKSRGSSSSSSSSGSSSSSLNHYKFKLGEIINENYKIEKLLGDGTFGRVLECTNLQTKENCAIKVIRPIERYIDSAEIEAEILQHIKKIDVENISHCVNMLEQFKFKDANNNYLALVFEKLGKSLFEFIKENNYRGYPMEMIQEFAKQIFEGISFLHNKLKLTHTDLKPENLLLKHDKKEIIKDRKDWPKNVILKEKNDAKSSTNSEYLLPSSSEIKIIDFGGATYDDDRHSDIINTRQYRAPEVILGCCKWNEKSDIWSIACILVELYTGELFFPTHDNEEHLCLIEKICGPIPEWMTVNTRQEFKELFTQSRTEEEIQKDGHRVNFKKLSKKNKTEKAVEDLQTLKELIHNDHKLFIDFIESLLIVDPELRPSCNECLRHEFFNIKFN